MTLEHPHLTLHHHLERLLCLPTVAFCGVLAGLDEPSAVTSRGRRA